MTPEIESRQDDAVLWPLIQVLGDIARRVERDEEAASTEPGSDDDNADAA